MPKLKTHKGTAKRIKRTVTGKLLRDRAFGGHFLSKKSQSRKRGIRHTATVTGSIARKLKKVLGA
ncbi:MAG: 50S ribosomal protein L35 [Candidatus Chaera renei]|uniref:Large ribosomal subunit protein bL35 n=1 Tax=Candidatus Chaera renei TaxID=2506947 RepID=A0A4Q0AJA4_9BACT|nr:MAG: 50S ribosomal protein L35 [Candidatus Chaera renei]